MSDPYELDCKKSVFGGVYYISNNTFKCYYQTANLIANRYVRFSNIGLLSIIIILSFFVRKIYAWILLNQTLLHLYNHVLLIENENGVIIIARLLPFKEFFRNSAHISPYVSMLGLAVSRYIAFYFPNFYDKYVTNKTIFPIILLWDLMCYIPFWGWQYIYYYTDFQQCPQYSKNVCDIVHTYFTLGNFAKYEGKAQAYQKQYYDFEKMKNNSVKYDECFEYKDCFQGRSPPFNDNISNKISAGLAVIALILSIFLFVRIIMHLKTQSNVNRNSLKTSFRVAGILLFQATYFFFDNTFNILKSFFQKEFVALIGSRVYTNIFSGSYASFYYFYITVDCLLIMFLLTDFRYYLLYFIPKRSSSAQVSVISSSSFLNSRS